MTMNRVKSTAKIFGKEKISSMLRTSCMLLIAGLVWNCNKKLSYNYETESMEQGEKGTVMVKVFSYGESVEDAVQRAKMDAVHAVLFKGIPGSNVEDPLVKNQAKAQENHTKFFKEFFGVELLDKRVREKGGVRYGSKSADYRLYVERSGDGSINPKDRVKVDGGYKVGVPVTVNHSRLRKRLEKEEIVKEFGL